MEDSTGHLSGEKCASLIRAITFWGLFVTTITTIRPNTQDTERQMKWETSDFQKNYIDLIK